MSSDSMFRCRREPDSSRRAHTGLLASLGLVLAAGAVDAAAPAPDPIVKARAAYQQRDRASLAALRKSTAAQSHPLAMWVDYWALSLRLRTTSQADVDAFYSRWPGTAVRERLRKDWIVERGKHGDASVVDDELSRVRGADDPEQELDRGRERDREVECRSLVQRMNCGSPSARPTTVARSLPRRCTAPAISRATTSGRGRAWRRNRAGAMWRNTRSVCSAA
jgi:hypothetical protein